MAILNVFGQLGPLLGTRLYPDSDKPYFIRGMSICAGFMLLVAVLAIALRRVLMKANDRAQNASVYEMVGQSDGAGDVHNVSSMTGAVGCPQERADFAFLL